jgi:hypothetical protein
MPSRPSFLGRTSRTRVPRSGLCPTADLPSALVPVNLRSKDVAIQPKDSSARDAEVHPPATTRLSLSFLTLETTPCICEVNGCGLPYCTWRQKR